ncbi:MAG: hypothetical protein GY737_14770 [Desulfobacteraceae bacterium]|nr:hypothetical protein [Desulfobacteraceae bacterium]
MTQWYEPITVSEWLKRTLSLFNLFLLVALATLVFSEFRFDWGERLIGNYLASTNALRPEIGIVWQTGNQASRAHTALDSMVTERRDTARAVQVAATFAELAGIVLPGQWTSLDSDRFKELYLGLAPDIATELIPPSELVWLFGSPGLTRIFCQGTSQGLEIYFLGSDNRVIRQLDLDHSFLSGLEKQETSFPGKLEDIPGFAGRIFPADRFFKVLLSLPKEVQPDLITTPETLLREKGHIVRAGIWNEAKSGYIRLGFEFRENGHTKIVFVRAREWAVWRLSMGLAKGDQ